MERNYISFSQINLYSLCGVQYYYRYIAGIKTPSSPAQIQGKNFHAALELNLRQKIESATDIPLQQMEDFYTDATEKAFADEVFLKAAEAEKGKTAVRDEVIKKGRIALGTYYREHAPGIQPLEVEKGFFANLGDDMPPLYGIIDLITTDLRVIDHKTASKSPSEGDADKSQQLSAYAIGFNTLYGMDPTSLELQYTVVTEKGNAKAVTLKTQRSKDQIARFLNRARAAVHGIQKEVFCPPDQSSWACGCCAYREMCQF